jgi:hypothetical protein
MMRDAILFATFLVTIAGAADFFSDKGSIEVGGAVSFGRTQSNAGTPAATTLSIAPTVHFFPARYFMLGPSLPFSGTWQGGSSVTQTGIGGRVGFVHPVGRLFLFCESGLSFVNQVHAYSTGGFSTWNGYEVPVSVGLKIPLQKHISFNIEPSAYFEELSGTTFTHFGISWGVTGLIF